MFEDVVGIVIGEEKDSKQPSQSILKAIVGDFMTKGLMPVNMSKQNELTKEIEKKSGTAVIAVMTFKKFKKPIEV